MATDNPLNFDRPRVFVRDAESVLFFVRRGERLVRCYVTRAALAAGFGAELESDSQEACVRAYDTHRERIHRLTQQVLDHREHGEGCLVVITQGDVEQYLADGGVHAQKPARLAAVPALA